MVLVFKLIALPGHGSHISSAMAWGTFPVCGPSLGHVQGRCVKGRWKIAVGPQGVLKYFRSIGHHECQQNHPVLMFRLNTLHTYLTFTTTWHHTKKSLKCFILSIRLDKRKYMLLKKLRSNSQTTQRWSNMDKDNCYCCILLLVYCLAESLWHTRKLKQTNMHNIHISLVKKIGKNWSYLLCSCLLCSSYI